MEKFYWQVAKVIEVIQETPRVKTIVLELSQWIPHLPGQHYDIRLTAEDGYQAQRSYSIASPPGEAGQIALTFELIKDGEVSTYLFESVTIGDSLEVRGPIGGYFVWKDEMANNPLLLVGGGSGVVPLMAMIRHRTKIGAINSTAFLYSIRGEEEMIYQKELTQLAARDPDFHLLTTFTRLVPAGWTGYKRRIDFAMLSDALSGFKTKPNCFVCGPTSFVEHVANALLDLGLPAEIIRTERFGPS